ncbi:13532_t:CDS:2, partial [Gigaspora rosea]
KQELIDQKCGQMDYGIGEKLTALLVEHECGQTDYGLLEKLIAESSSKKEKPHEFRINYKGKTKEDKRQEVGVEEKNRKNENCQEVEMQREMVPIESGNVALSKNFNAGDIPLDLPRVMIKKLTERFGKTEILKVERRNRKAEAVVKINFENEEKRQCLEQTWMIPSRAGYMSRITKGVHNPEELKSRKRFRAIIKGLPRTAKEILLLRQLAHTKAKGVFIPPNKNGNQKQIAIVYFDSKMAGKEALKHRIRYYNHVLDWSNEEGVEVWRASREKRHSIRSKVGSISSYKKGWNRERKKR